MLQGSFNRLAGLSGLWNQIQRDNCSWQQITPLTAAIFNLPDVLGVTEWDYDEVKLAETCSLFLLKMKMKIAQPGIALHNNLNQ